MKVKSYYAPSIEAAMSSAAQEMGPDAVLITSRRTGADAKHLGEYEVVFGLANEPSRQENSRPNEKPAPGADLELIRREMQEMRRAMNAAWRQATSNHWTPEMSQADAILTEADVPLELKDDLLSALDAKLREELLYDQARSAAGERRKPRVRPIDLGGSRGASLLRDQLAGMLEVAPRFQSKDGRSIVALVGPSGAGKTTTLVKLGIQHGLTARRPTLIISTDTYRVGATEQLRIYAAAIGVNFQVADTPLGLRQLIEEHSSKQLILIDTPGLAPSDMDVCSDVARFLSLHPDIEVQLLLPATLRATSLAQVAKRFAVYGPSKAILTKLDEADTYGAALGQAILSNLPVSFVTTGQQIPDDLVPADKDRLLSLLSGLEIQPAAASVA